MNRIYLTLLLIHFVALSYAQGIAGKVLDTKNEPIPFANVVLLDAKDSTFISGTVTKEDGSYRLGTGTNGNILKVSSVGYVTKFIALNGNDIGRICLKEDSRLLQEVVIRGMRPQYKTVTGGQNIDIRNSMLKDVGTANAVLSMLPGIEGNNGHYIVFAKGTPEIYIDNRKVENANELNYLKSNDIKSIDILTSPGARYNAEVRAVIRIHTVKGTSDGFGVTAFGQGEHGRKWTTYDDASVRYRRGGLEVTGALSFTNGYNAADGTIHADIRRGNNSISILQVVPNEYWYTTMGGKIGASYDFDTNSSIGLSYKLDGSLYERGKAYTQQTIERNGALEGKVNQRMTIADNENPQHEANLYYVGKVGKFGIDFNGTWVWRKSSRSQMSAETSDELDNRVINSDNTNRNRMWATKLAFTYPLWQGELSMGSEVSHTNTHGVYDNREQILVSSDDEIREDNTAAFAEYSVQISHFNIAAGMRYERVKSHYYSFGDFRQDQSRDYSSFFPNVLIGWRNGQAVVQLNYGKRISRPGYQSLSSNVQYDNRYEYEGGNPALIPTLMHDVDLVFTYSWLNMTVGYCKSSDVRFTYADFYQEGSDVVIWRQMNFDRQQSFNASITLSPRFGFYRPTLVLGYWQQIFDAKAYGVSENLNKPLMKLDFRNWFDIGKTAKAMLHLRYRSGYDDGFTSNRHAVAVNLRFQKDLLKKSLTVSVYANDLFKQLRERWIGYYSVATMSKDTYNYTRCVGVSVSYNFNNTERSKYKGTGAGNKEKGRL